MVCLRGPCEHFWLMTTRADLAEVEDVDGNERIYAQRHRTCIRAAEESDLGEQNVYDCDQWWPAPLAWVPVSARSLMRPWLRDQWERWLQRRGYDFTWRWFKLDAFEDDARMRRMMRRVSKPRFGATPTEEGK